MSKPFQHFVTLSLTAVPLLFVGCTQATHADQAGEEMSAALSQAETENDRHEADCGQASSMLEVMSELTSRVHGRRESRTRDAHSGLSTQDSALVSSSRFGISSRERSGSAIATGIGPPGGTTGAGIRASKSSQMRLSERQS